MCAPFLMTLNYSARVPSFSIFHKKTSHKMVSPKGLSSEGLVLLACSARFLSNVHSVQQACHFQDILRSGTSFQVTRVAGVALCGCC